jgi:PAS domain S-box-containing protein/putative nucleotidyltransferase with HDIG domain
LADSGDNTGKIRDMSDSPATVLLIEDNPGDARLIREMLAEGEGDRFKVVCARQLSSGLERLAANDIEAVLLDLGLPDSQGFDTFAKAYAQAPGVPIIVLSGLTDEQLAIKTVQEGAQDYLVKGHLDSHSLVRTIRYAIERKRTEESLRESETQVRKLFEALPDSILVHDDEGTILHINEVGAERLEWSAKDLVGRNLRDIVTPESRASIADHIRETHEVGWCRFETTYVSRSGWQIVAEVNDRPIKFGKEKAILRVARDITERKEAERALLREKNFSDTIMNSSPGLLFVFDDKGNIIRWNRNAEKVTGYSTKEISKMNVLDFVAKEAQKTAAEAMQEVFTRGQSSLEINVLSKPGKKIPFHITGLCTKLENTTCAVCTGIDITERKEAQKELQRSYHKLRESLIATVNTLASTIEMKDPYTAGHQRRVTMLACAIAEGMGLTEELFDGLRMAGLIHDIGKISVPAEILNKSGRISDTEFNIIKIHPQVGYDLLKEIEFPWPVARIVLQHHERLDGSGYPQGLKDGEIMLEAKILAVADVVEAMASHRPYRPALGIEAALKKITENRGIIYDPEVVDICTRVFLEKGFTFE